MKTETTLLGWFKYRKENRDMVCFECLAQSIPSERGNGYYTKNFYVSQEQGLHNGLKAGKVEIETNAWNSNILEKIKNI